MYMKLKPQLTLSKLHNHTTKRAPRSKSVFHPFGSLKSTLEGLLTLEKRIEAQTKVISDEGEPHRQIVLGINAPDIVEFKPSGSKPPVIEIDTGSHFQTDMTSEDRGKLIEWARNIAVKLNFGIIIGKSDFGVDRRKPYLMLVCERSGTYVSKGKKFQKAKSCCLWKNRT